MTFIESTKEKSMAVLKFVAKKPLNFAGKCYGIVTGSFSFEGVRHFCGTTVSREGLYKYVISNNIDKIEWLAKKNININSPLMMNEASDEKFAKENSNKTPLFVALEKGNLEAAETLLKLGADKYFSLKNGENYLTQLFSLTVFEKNITKKGSLSCQIEDFSKKKDKILKIAELLLKGERALDINYKNTITGKTILHQISSNSFTDNEVLVKFLPEIIRFLINKGAITDNIDKESKKPINYLGKVKNNSKANEKYLEEFENIKMKSADNFEILKRSIKEDEKKYENDYKAGDLFHDLFKNLHYFFSKKDIDLNILKIIQKDCLEIKKHFTFGEYKSLNTPQSITFCNNFLLLFSKEIKKLDSVHSKKIIVTNEPQLDTIKALLKLGNNSEEELVKEYAKEAYKKSNKDTILELRKLGYKMSCLDDLLKNAFLQKDLVKIKFLIDVKAKIPLDLQEPLLHYLLASKNPSPENINTIIDSLKKSGIDLFKLGMPDDQDATQFINYHKDQYDTENLKAVSKYLPAKKSWSQEFADYFRHPNQDFEQPHEQTEGEIMSEISTNFSGDISHYN